MCGIAGIINKDRSSVDKGILKSMADTLSHRGPDAEGEFIDGAIGFYHKRLSIIDLESGNQPMSFDGITIVYNGEIYNYQELRKQLQLKGQKFKTNSDTEVIIRMYQHFGQDCLDLLNGMFAFLIYDSKSNKILVARDHFGIKPLYWYEDKEKILFASEIKALLVHPEVKTAPNFNSIQEYLTFQFVLGEETMFEDIYKVQAGYSRELDLRNFEWKDNCYWEPNFNLDPYHTEDYFVDELRSLLEDTVKIQLRSDVPVGTYLSGGLDSSLVTMLASKYYGGGLKSFTGAFREGQQFDESSYAKIVAEAAGSEFHLTYATERQFIDLMPKLIYHLDEPVAGPGVFPQYIVSKMARENVTVCLGGQGGDEIFGGYARYLVAYLEQALKGAIFTSNEEGEHIVSLNSILPNLPALENYIPMMKSFWKSDAFEEMDRRYYNLVNRMGDAAAYINQDVLCPSHQSVVYERFQSLFNHSDTKSYYNKMTHFDMFGSLPALLQVEDRVSMAVSLESRVPLLDRRIVDLVSVMPAGMKFKGGELKYLFKKAIKDIVPERIINRQNKMGFPVPLHLWTKSEAGDFIRDTLTSKNCRERGVFNTNEITKMIDSEKPYGRALWGLLSLELWFSTFMDK